MKDKVMNPSKGRKSSVLFMALKTEVWRVRLIGRICVRMIMVYSL